MSGFTAINLEPEDSFEEEVDDTRELQLEEAYKLYNQALRLHSQGPDYLDEAFHAYAELVQSDIFKDPEFASGYRQDQLDDHDGESVALPTADDAALALLPTNAVDPSAYSIPQLMFLAFKNRGQFVLEYSRLQVERGTVQRDDLVRFWSDACRKALADFAEALERDDSDLDLWKKASKVADVFSSQRIVRFCLESVLAGDDDLSDEAIDLSGLDEAFAAGELKKVVKSLEDDLSLQQTSETHLKQPLLKVLQHRNNPFPFLSGGTKSLMATNTLNKPSSSLSHVTSHELNVSNRTWLGVGQALLGTVNAEDHGSVMLEAGAAVKIALPVAADLFSTPSEVLADTTVTANQKHGSNEYTAVKAADITYQIPGEVAVESPEKEDVTMINAERGEADSPTIPDTNTDATSAMRGNTANSIELASRERSSALPSGAASVDLPTRKRSSTVAGNEEANETRSKSKRLRARESIMEGGPLDDEVIADYKQYYEDQLEVYKFADQWMFNVTNELLSQAEVDPVSSYDEVKAAFDQDTSTIMTEAEIDPKVSLTLASLSDMRQILISWSEDASQALLYGHGNQDLGGNAGLTLFSQHSKAGTSTTGEIIISNPEGGLSEFAEKMNREWNNLHMVVVSWLEALLCSGSADSLSWYARQSWSTELKQTVVTLMTQEDEHIHDALRAISQELKIRTYDSESTEDREPCRQLFEFVQTLFELHLDVYSLITNPSSLVDVDTRHRQRDRLCRWATFTSECLSIHLPASADEIAPDQLLLRYIWASTLYATLTDDIGQDHVMLCFKDLEKLMTNENVGAINLPNNVAMPEISAAAAQREMSRLSTLDFFMSVFDNSESEPVAIIERLEPILEPHCSGPDTSVSASHDTTHSTDGETTQMQKLISFLESGDVSLKLYLWRRLHNAYVAISYVPKTISCNLRSIETIVSELDSERHRKLSDELRRCAMLRWIKDADDLLGKLLGKVLNEENAFEAVDEEHLQSSISAVLKLSTIIHGFAMYEDSVRVGQTSVVSKSASFNRTFEKCRDRLREVEVRCWTMLYALLKDATVQMSQNFPKSADNLADYLRSVHNALGVRQYCRLSGKIFLKLVKKELLATQTEQDYSADIFQVLYDLHGLKFDPGVGDVDHGCPLENLDKKTAMQMVEIVMPYVNCRSIKDILKSELKGTIEKIQSALGAIKAAPELSYNKRQISHFLKSQINPKELYRCIKGIGNLASKPVHTDSAAIAAHGWYFLLGQIALTRFKAIKRINPTPTDDLDIASTFFRHDLEHDNEKWETWYRLAQIFDAKIEEDLVWNVSKINDHRPELATLQRNAIHAYTMAVATALRNADDDPETAQKMQDMFADFATRLYASSRQPLTMEAFQTHHNLRHYSGRFDQQMYKSVPYEPMRETAVWNFAAYLLRRKFTTKPKPWTTWYTLGKCLWKLFCADVSVNRGKKVTVEDVLNPLTWAIEALPPRKDSRSDTAYILEPHSKIASVVHKMVHRKAITPRQGVEWLQVTPYSRKINLSEDESGRPDWEEYILAVLKKLGAADKLNWHHRIIARAAHINYDDTQNRQGALGAKHEFTQQIFTKTMTMQVWKPEHERAGRHYVYTSRYVSFFVTLLDKLNDRTNFDLVLRRVRRKPTEFLEHQKLWEEIATKYVKLLRRQGKAPEAHEKTLFENMSHDEFSKKANLLEKWAHDPDTTSSMLEIVRDAVEIKKLNNSLMKGSIFDDLIADSYASMFETFVSQLPPEKAPTPPPNRTKNPATPGFDGISDASSQTQQWNAMRLGNIMGPSSVDGSSTFPKPMSILTSTPSLNNGPIGLGLQQAFLPPVAAPSGTTDLLRVPTKPGRPKTITRREVIRRAESAILKPPPIKTPTLSKKSITEVDLTLSRVGSASPGTRDAKAIHKLDDIKDEDVSVVSSRRGSVHDSADDESELSDVDDEAEASGKKTKTMFPGLIGKRKDAMEEDGIAASSPAAEVDDVDAEGDEDVEMGDVDDDDGDGDGDGDGDDADDDGEGGEDMNVDGANSEDQDEDQEDWHDAEEGEGAEDNDEQSAKLEIPDSQERNADEG